MKYPNQIKREKIVGVSIYENATKTNRAERRKFARKTGIVQKTMNTPYINHAKAKLRASKWKPTINT